MKQQSTAQKQKKMEERPDVPVSLVQSPSNATIKVQRIRLPAKVLLGNARANSKSVLEQTKEQKLVSAS